MLKYLKIIDYKSIIKIMGVRNHVKLKYSIGLTLVMNFVYSFYESKKSQTEN